MTKIVPQNSSGDQRRSPARWLGRSTAVTAMSDLPTWPVRARWREGAGLPPLLGSAAGDLLDAGDQLVHGVLGRPVLEHHAADGLTDGVLGVDVDELVVEVVRPDALWPLRVLRRLDDLVRVVLGMPERHLDDALVDRE